MKIVEPKYEILTDISEGGIKELQQIERVARVCYKSEDKITPDGESAKKLVGFLVKQGHEAKKRGVSKEEFNAEVFAWRVALGKVKRSSGQR